MAECLGNLNAKRDDEGVTGHDHRAADSDVGVTQLISGLNPTTCGRHGAKHEGSG